jgi:osmoprotectant transport system substrate-binding protein
VPTSLQCRSPRRLLPVLIALALTSCSIGTGLGPVEARAPAVVTGDGAITVASFEFPESVLLAEIYAQALESNGFTVKRALNVGARELVEPALERGLVEFVPEYLGTALQFVTRGSAAATSDAEAAHRELAQAFDGRGIVVLASAPAQDANALAVTAQTAADYDLKTISDLIPIAGQLVFGGPPECPDRPLCLLGFEETYGLEFERFQGLDASGPLTSAALASGQVDVALLFTTDGDIRTKGFVVLEDDRGLQPAENVTPVVRADIVAAYGSSLTDVVDAVSAMLTTEGLRQMNQSVSLGEETRDVAGAWLRSKGLVQE